MCQETHTRTLLSEPDSLGRRQYEDRWYNPNNAYCSVCGRDPQLGCEHVGTPEYGRRAQVFFGVPR